jgi:hypothetical protein
MATRIEIHGNRAQAVIQELDPDEGARAWRCSCGERSDRTFYTLADVINDAEVHLERRCPAR